MMPCCVPKFNVTVKNALVGEIKCFYLMLPCVNRELMLVADALRLGGAILSSYPDMLAAQLVGRLLPEMDNNPHVKMLLKQCDQEGIHHCALMPSYHCMHTPGGPLKVSDHE